MLFQFSGSNLNHNHYHCLILRERKPHKTNHFKTYISLTVISYVGVRYFVYNGCCVRLDVGEL